jgi:hypothetical protein
MGRALAARWVGRAVTPTTLIEGVRFVLDSPLEGDGFEPSVPRDRWRRMPLRSRSRLPPRADLRLGARELRLKTVVVFETPPLWLKRLMILATAKSFDAD